MLHFEKNFLLKFHAEASVVHPVMSVFNHVSMQHYIFCLQIPTCTNLPFVSHILSLYLNGL